MGKQRLMLLDVEKEAMHGRMSEMLQKLAHVDQLENLVAQCALEWTDQNAHDSAREAYAQHVAQLERESRRWQEQLQNGRRKEVRTSVTLIANIASRVTKANLPIMWMRWKQFTATVKRD